MRVTRARSTGWCSSSCAIVIGSPSDRWCLTNDAPSTAPSGPRLEQAGPWVSWALHSSKKCRSDIGYAFAGLRNELIELHVEPVVTVNATMRRGAGLWP